MPVAAIFRLVQLLIAVAGNPLVVKFVENMIAGTPTKIDDVVWKVLKMFLVTGAPADPGLPEALDEIQRKFDQDRAAAKEPAPDMPFSFENV